MLITFEPGWREQLASEFSKPYFETLRQKVQKAYRTETVFPAPENIFAAFALCPWSELKIVILGQDPYHDDGQATGLAFGVPIDEAVPPSLRNIYKEIGNDMKVETAPHGDLSLWARQGVLLLNTTLTVAAHKPKSHNSFGWEKFTDSVIETISNEKEHVVFLLWGNDAKAKAKLIDTKKHLVLEASHPSPLSARHSFFGCKHFSKTNDYLAEYGIDPIQW